MENIKELIKKKYNTWDWNFGKSPTFIFKKESEVDGKTMCVELMIVNGKIIDCKLSYGHELMDQLKEIELKAGLTRKRYSYRVVRNVVKRIFDKDMVHSITRCFF